MLTGLQVPSMACKCVFYGPDIMQRVDPMELILKEVKCKNEIYQRIELKEQMKKWGH